MNRLMVHCMLVYNELSHYAPYSFMSGGGGGDHEISPLLNSLRENYLWGAGQNVRQALSALPDILIPWQTFFQWMTGKYQWPFLFSLSDIFCVLDPAGQNVRQCLSSLPDISKRHVRHISRSLPKWGGVAKSHAVFLGGIPRGGTLCT